MSEYQYELDRAMRRIANLESEVDEKVRGIRNEMHSDKPDYEDIDIAVDTALEVERERTNKLLRALARELRLLRYELRSEIHDSTK